MRRATRSIPALILVLAAGCTPASVETSAPWSTHQLKPASPGKRAGHAISVRTVGQQASVECLPTCIVTKSREVMEVQS